MAYHRKTTKYETFFKSWMFEFNLYHENWDNDIKKVLYINEIMIILNTERFISGTFKKIKIIYIKWDEGKNVLQSSQS